MKNPTASRAFTLMELLVVIAVIAVLAALVMPVFNSVKMRGYQTGALSNMRQVGAATLLFAAEHDYQIPGRVKTAEVSETKHKWPGALKPYIQDDRIYAAPGDPASYLLRHVDPTSDTGNNTSYIMNGYDDLGSFTNNDIEIHINRIENPSQTILFGTPKSTKAKPNQQYFMDFEEPPHGNHTDVLDLEKFTGGSNYVFADGSARYISKKEYNQIDSEHAASGEGYLWKTNKEYETPKF